MSPEAHGIVATSIVGNLLPRLTRTHRRRRIAVIAGPPGIGKSTAIRLLKEEEQACVAVVSVPPGPAGGLKPMAALHLAIEAVDELLGPSYRERAPSAYVELRNRFFGLVCRWAGIPAAEVRRDHLDAEQFPPLTLVFDEAQNLSREAIEMLRFLNDGNGGFSPLPVGLIFVGNNEFILKAERGGPSVLSAAVADRALYIETFAYSDVTNDDLALFFEARGVIDTAALQLVVRHFGSGRTDRSFRRAADLAADLIDEAAGAPITPEIVREVLSLV
jgi:hypothetical protein